MGKELNSTAGSLLGFLHYGPQTGWDLVAMAELLIGDFWSLTRSQVYRELAAMEERGLVEAGPTGPRDRRPYALTDAGRAAFAEWVQRPPAAENIRFPLLLTMTFGRHLPPERLAGYLADHRRRHAERLADYEREWAAATEHGEGPPDSGDTSPAADAAGADPYVLATLAFGMRYERAVLEWFDALPDWMRDPPRE